MVSRRHIRRHQETFILPLQDDLVLVAFRSWRDFVVVQRDMHRFEETGLQLGVGGWAGRREGKMRG